LSDWFIKNNGSSYLLVDSEDEAGTGSTASKAALLNGLISFNDLVDESYVSSNNMDIS
jgi:hypothetical protein